MDILKVSDITGSSTLVFSRPSEGKTTAIMNDCLARSLNPLWITATNIDPLVEAELDWDIARFGSWEDLDTFLRSLGTKEGFDITPYDTAVLDGLHIVSDMYLASRTNATEDPRRQYNMLSMKVTGMIARLREQFQNIFVSVDIKDAKDGAELGVNDAMARKIAGLFGSKKYVYASPLKGGGTTYTIQTDPIRALALRKVTKQDAKN